MIAMAEKLDAGKYLTVAEAVEVMGCSDGWVRQLLRTGGLPGAKRIGQRLWLIPEASAVRAREDLTTRSTGKRHLAERPAAARKAAKRRKK